MNNENLKLISNEDLVKINGGHEGLAHDLGAVAAGVVLTILGLFAGISEGIDEGLNKK